MSLPRNFQAIQLPWKDTPEFQALLTLGDPKAEAWAWIEAYAKNLSTQVAEYEYGDYPLDEVTSIELIDCALSQQEESDWGDYIIRDGVFEGKLVDPTFFTKLEQLLGMELDNHASFFSCSC